MPETNGKAAPGENGTASPAEGEPSRDRRFDSHCIEHSFELTLPLRQFLRGGGCLLSMATHKAVLG
jgi:hypothetical protein